MHVGETVLVELRFGDALAVGETVIVGDGAVPLTGDVGDAAEEAAFEVDAGEASYLNPIGLQIQRHCLEQGVYLRPLGNVVYLLPPLSISDQQLERCYAAIASAIRALL